MINVFHGNSIASLLEAAFYVYLSVFMTVCALKLRLQRSFRSKPVQELFVKSVFCKLAAILNILFQQTSIYLFGVQIYLSFFYSFSH